MLGSGMMGGFGDQSAAGTVWLVPITTGELGHALPFLWRVSAPAVAGAIILWSQLAGPMYVL